MMIDKFSDSTQVTEPNELSEQVLHVSVTPLDSKVVAPSTKRYTNSFLELKFCLFESLVNLFVASFDNSKKIANDRQLFHAFFFFGTRRDMVLPFHASERGKRIMFVLDLFDGRY